MQYLTNNYNNLNVNLNETIQSYLNVLIKYTKFVFNYTN